VSLERFLVGTERGEKPVVPVERAALHLVQGCLQLYRKLFSKLHLRLPCGELLLRVAEPRELLHERERDVRVVVIYVHRVRGAARSTPRKRSWQAASFLS
jgi:hypothetical protein